MKMCSRSELKKLSNGYYYVKWLNYEDSYNTWEKCSKVEKTVAFTIDKYWEKLKAEGSPYAPNSNRTSRASSLCSESRTSEQPSLRDVATPEPTIKSPTTTTTITTSKSTTLAGRKRKLSDEEEHFE